MLANPEVLARNCVCILRRASADANNVIQATRAPTRRIRANPTTGRNFRLLTTLLTEPSKSLSLDLSIRGVVWVFWSLFGRCVRPRGVLVARARTHTTERTPRVTARAHGARDESRGRSGRAMAQDAHATLLTERSGLSRGAGGRVKLATPSSTRTSIGGSRA